MLRTVLVLALLLAQTSIVARMSQQVIVTVKPGEVFLLVREEKENETTVTRVVYRDVFAVDYPVRFVDTGIWVVRVTARRHRPFEQRVECDRASTVERQVDRLAIAFDDRSAAMQLVQFLTDRFDRRQ